MGDSRRMYVVISIPNCLALRVPAGPASPWAGRSGDFADGGPSGYRLPKLQCNSKYIYPHSNVLFKFNCPRGMIIELLSMGRTLDNYPKLQPMWYFYPYFAGVLWRSISVLRQLNADAPGRAHSWLPTDRGSPLNSSSETSLCGSCDGK